MNNYACEARKRSQTLLIVEGNHEKNVLFRLLFRCFPEMKIDIDNVWIYGTNVYLLYEDIVKEYGEDWAKEDMDIDLPFVISKKQTPEQLRYKDNFTNIILVFDYERHDTNFSETKILSMQKVFSDSTNIGKLYINYPMIESYQHLKSIPDEEYFERKIPVTLQPGHKYKSLVRQETIIGKMINFPKRIDDLLEKHFEISNEVVRKRCCERILNISEAVNIERELQIIMHGVVESEKEKTLLFQLKDWIANVGYAYDGQSYWKRMKGVFIEIINHNICKAIRIQNGGFEIENNQYRECFEILDFIKILKHQNIISANVTTGYIWELNTCIFLVADYKLDLVID